MADMSKTIVARSDQMNAVDLVGGSLTTVITKVEVRDTKDQPVSVYVRDWPQPWKPSKTMCRIMVIGWGKDSDAYIGRSVTLFRNPVVKWAGEAVGGIEIADMSHLESPIDVRLQVSKGVTRMFHVGKLTDIVAAWTVKIAGAVDAEELKQVAAQIRELKLSPADSASLRAAYQRKDKEFKEAAEPSNNELPATNDPYQALQQRIRTCQSGADASTIKVDISAALERGEITREESDELAEMLRKEMT